MIPRAASSVTKRRITLSSPVLQRDASTGPSVDVKARTVLSRLPVPPLRSTLDKYLQSIKPLLLEDDLRGVSAFDLAYQQRVQWAKEFEVGIGATLQARLIALDKKSPHNWLDDNFWLRTAYLEWRAPVLINSNWWLIFQDDVEIPESAMKGLSERVIGISPWQIRRSASLVHHTLVYKDTLAQSVNLPELTKSQIWLNNSSSKMWNIARVPRPNCDVHTAKPYISSPDARSITVLIHDFFYVVEVYDESCKPHSPGIVERSLWSCVRDVERRLASGERAKPIGILTTDDRDRWAENYDRLRSLSSANGRALDAIHHSVMCLSLDHFTSPVGSSGIRPRNCKREIKEHLNLVRSSWDGKNRFMDKPFSFVVDPLTRAGATGEHSPVDALVPSIVTEYAIVQGVLDDSYISTPEVVSSEPPRSNCWRRLDWVTDDRIEREVGEAEGRAKAIIADSDDNVLHFSAYGADWIKIQARLSPDAYIQMALQLAWFRTRREFTATYETALTRLFHHGRTETIRTLTNESRDWVRSMCDTTVSPKRKLELLNRAVQTHTRLTREAATGRGIDRHLLGLRLLMRPEDGETADLFSDGLFQRSQTWKLSTSGLSAGHQFRGTGFGAPYADGYGINYLAGPDLIKFGIESKKACTETSTEAFIDAIDTALQDMRDVCTEGANLPHPTARL